MECLLVLPPTARHHNLTNKRKSFVHKCVSCIPAADPRLSEEEFAGDATRHKRRKTRRARNERLTASRAPINTTQFLMNDDKRNSPSSDWERFNSSGSEDEYERKEFSRAYESGGSLSGEDDNSRYWSLCKSELIREYLSLENSVSKYEKKYKILQETSTSANFGKCEHKQLRTKVHSKFSAEIMEKIRIFKTEIGKVHNENVDLAAENTRLLAERSSGDNSDSSSSSASSSSSSSSDESSSEGDGEDDQEKLDDGRRDDTGYESDRSSSAKLEVTSSTGR